MPQEVTCHCALCNLEARLLSDLSYAEAGAIDELFSASHGLRQHSSALSLLSHLKTSPMDATSDELLRELFAIRALNATIHREPSRSRISPNAAWDGSPRRKTTAWVILRRHYATGAQLSATISVLQRTPGRQSHFAFAISRAVKRQLFEWASRESGKTGLLNHFDGETFTMLAGEVSFERHALLRHFLHRCVTKGLLTDSELNLLIDFKLYGTNGEEFADFNGTSSNAVRQSLSACSPNSAVWRDNLAVEFLKLPWNPDLESRRRRACPALRTM